MSGTQRQTLHRPVKKRKNVKGEARDTSAKTELVEEYVKKEPTHNTPVKLEENEGLGINNESDEKTPKKKPKKTKEIQTIPNDMVFVERLSKVTKFIGAHVSVSGGVHNAIENSLTIGANAFALFLKNQRRWTSPPLEPDQISAFRTNCANHSYPSKYILPHGSYLINLGNPDEEKRKKSFDAFLDDLKRCESLGLTLYNFHPGSTVGACTIEESIQHIADCINMTHKLTKNVVCVIENMAGSGNVVGSKFEELGQIIARVEDKKRVGVCFDTCHAFAAGYDLRNSKVYEATMTEFSRHIGFEYLRGMHINDSLLGLGSRRDRHENIGRGHLGLEAFRLIMNDSRLDGIPLILETPLSADDDDMTTWKNEVNLLYGLVGKVEGDVPIAVDEPKKSKKSKSGKGKKIEDYYNNSQ